MVREKDITVEKKGKEFEIIMPKRTRQIPFRYKLQPLDGKHLVENCPLDGEITEVTMHWPSGCEDITTGEGLVDIAFGHSDQWVLPCIRNEYLAFSAATPSFRNIHEPVSKGEEIWVRLRNADSVNVHAVSVACTIEGYG